MLLASRAVCLMSWSDVVQLKMKRSLSCLTVPVHIQCTVTSVACLIVLFPNLSLILQRQLRVWSLQRAFRVAVALSAVLLVVLYGTCLVFPTSRTLKRRPGWLSWYYTTRDTAKPSNISVFLESYNDLVRFYGDEFGKINVDACALPNGARCIYQSSEPMADVVFRMTTFIHPNTYPLRYCPNQILAVLHSEAENNQYGLYQMKFADIRIDHHPSSDAMYGEICTLPIDKWENSQSYSDASERKGIALFLSNCWVQWRTEYIWELMQHVDIDSYGECFHNVPERSSRGNRLTMADIASKYRMVVTFENTIQTDYITEKIALTYQSGAIPVYWGPPEIYLWVPGNHSFIDASRFDGPNGPQKLGEYLKKVAESDEVFRYHTTNFDVEKSRAIMDKYCFKSDYFCRVCRLGYQKVERHMASSRVVFRPAQELHASNPCNLHGL